MRHKRLIAALLGLALVAVCAAILMIFWSSIALLRAGDLRLDAFSFSTVSAQAAEEQRFAVADGARLDLSTLAGDVQVTGGLGSEIVVTARKTGWGVDDADAQAALEEVRVVMEQAGNNVTVKVERPTRIVLAGHVREVRVDFEVQVPAGTQVAASTGYGAVSASGLAGGAVLASNSGPVSASALAGDVELSSDYGPVTLEQSLPAAVNASSSSGRVSLVQVEASGAVTLASGYGDVSFEGGAASTLEASTRSGRVTLAGLAVRGAVVARSDYGRVSVADVAAAGGYTLASSSGDVSLDGATGSVSAESGYGDVSVVNAAGVTLDLHSRSGAVTFAGSLGAGPHTLRSNYGNIRLSLPPDTAANVELSTGYGSIRSAFALTLSGDLNDDHWQGVINGGGPSLTVRTDSGSITLDHLTS